MTFREKLKKEYPEKIDERRYGGCWGCPYDYGYEPHGDRPCSSHEWYKKFIDCRDRCTACWDRTIPGTEVPETEPTKFKFNVNHYMYVKLTNYGKELIIKKHGYDYFEHCIEAYKQEDGYYELQCHDVMSLFGDSIYNGCKLPFETTVYFDSKDLEPAQEEVLE